MLISNLIVNMFDFYFSEWQNTAWVEKRMVCGGNIVYKYWFCEIVNEQKNVDLKSGGSWGAIMQKQGTRRGYRGADLVAWLHKELDSLAEANCNM